MKIDIRAIASRPSFWVVILIGLAAQLVPYVLTLGAPAADGNRVAGFPFTFVSYGGLCVFIDGHEAGQCPQSFIPLHIFFNMVVIVGIAALITWYREHQENSRIL